MVDVDWSERPRERDRGYVKVWCPEHPRSFGGGWVYEHRLVAEQKLGRFLQPGETVHHILEKHDNRPEAIIVCPVEEHVEVHR